MYLSVTELSRLYSLKDGIIYKSVHTSDGILIGNIYDIDNDTVVVEGHIVNTVYYHIPIEKVREWDGHALWLTMDDKESRKHILTSHTTSTKDSIITSESLELDLEEDILNQIIHGAESHGISPTSYTNQILKRCLEWDKFEPKAGIVPISKPVAKELFDNLSEEQIVSMAKNMSKNVLQKTVIKFIRDKQKQQIVEYEENQEKDKEKQKLDMNSFLLWLENEMNNYAVEIRHIISNKDDDTSNNNSSSSRHHTYILKHDAGYNYSLYYKTLLESIFNEVLRKHISTKIKSTMLTFEFEEQSI
jgi:hypothetical protein